MRYSLGIDVGSSSVKISLMDIETGECVASATNPSCEMPIDAIRDGWAEQDPMMWWKYVCEGIRSVTVSHPASEIACIGITYQMHGLVTLDKNFRPVRKAIIWCDSRAVSIGDEALGTIGKEKCLEHLLNSPGNFTASKLAWVKRNEAELYDRIEKFCLPGDFIAYMLSGELSTTQTGLSEQILWDFKKGSRADFVADYYGIDTCRIPDTVPMTGVQARTDAKTEQLLGIRKGTPISYRAGDQPNNAFSLNVLDAGEIAATGGTSGVVYGVTDVPEADPLSRVNTFVHVNHTGANPRYGVLLCINGTGIMNAWIRRNLGQNMDYEQMNAAAASIPVGSDGVLVLPFGNGAERMLCNRSTGGAVSGLNLNRHSAAHVFRATQEGIAFSFRYGIDIMREIGLKPNVIRAGKANLFLSPIFRQTLSTLADASIELFNTDGSLGAARGAALGADFYRTRQETFASLKKVGCVTPHPEDKSHLEEAYGKWKDELERKLFNI